MFSYCSVYSVYMLYFLLMRILLIEVLHKYDVLTNDTLKYIIFSKK